MVQIFYQEPLNVKVAMIMYEMYERRKKGNVTSILSDAIMVLRQFGPAGLKRWLENPKNNGERSFILKGLEKSCSRYPGRFSFNLEVEDFDDAWSEVEQLISILCWAKYYAKTR